MHKIIKTSVFICLQVVVIVMTVISMEAYEIKRDVVFPNVDSTYHRTPRLREFFLDQLFVDRAAGPQTSAVIPMRDRTVSQRALRDVSSKDRVIYSSGFSTFRHQPTKQNPFTVTSFRDKPLVKQAMPKTRKVRAEWASFADNPFEGPSLVPEEIFEGQASTYGSQAQFKEQLFTGAPFKSLFRGQLSPAEPAPFERQTTFVEPPSISSSIKFHRDVTPIDSYEQYKDMMTSLDGKSAKYGKLHRVTRYYTISGMYNGNFLHNVTLRTGSKFFSDNGRNPISFFFPDFLI